MSKVAIIAKRDYLSRVRTPGFWIATVIIPLLMGAWIILPSLIMAKSRSGLHLAIVDTTGAVAPRLQAQQAAMAKGREGGEGAVDLRLEVVPPGADARAQRAELDRRVLRDDIDAWLWITPEGLAKNEAEYHGRTLSNIMTIGTLERALTRIVREQRLTAAGYDPAQVEKLVASVDFTTTKVTEKGGKAGGGMADFLMPLFLFIILYTTVMIYGQMVMQGVLEEKANRIVEVVASSAKPTELMAGKLIGICGVALTQIGIWLVSAAVLTAPRLIGALAAGRDLHLPTLTPAMVGHFVVFFLLGFVFYASFFALVGAAFNSPQEAQQLVSVGTLFLAAPLFFFMPVINDPQSNLAVVTSLIPMFTPTVMLLRIAIRTPPLWQLALGYTLTILADVLMVWICARVYRIGILMYGKRPTIQEIWRWARYA